MNPRDGDSLQAEPPTLREVRLMRRAYRAGQEDGTHPTFGYVIIAVVAAVLVLAAFTVGRATASPRTAPSTEELEWRSFVAQNEPRQSTEAEGGEELAPVRPSHNTTPPGAVISGLSTWYCGGGSPCTAGYGPGDLIAAIDPTLGIAKGERITVRHGDRAVSVVIRDVCACPGRRIVDLSRAAFSRLADPSRGVIAVTVETEGPTITPPATDIER